MFLYLFLEIPLFYCLQTIENNRKSMGTIDFRNFLQTPKKVSPFYVYWPNLVLLAWLLPILWMIQYFSKYIGNILDLPFSRHPFSLNLVHSFIFLLIVTSKRLDSIPTFLSELWRRPFYLFPREICLLFFEFSKRVKI